MYRTYKLTEKEDGKITKMRWDGDTHYYNVFETQEECDEEEKRLAKIEEDYIADFWDSATGEIYGSY